MTIIPVREPERLRSSRWSSPHEDHFLTLCIDRRAPGLATPQFHSEFHAATHLLTLEGKWHVRTATVMPYHVHFLVTLGESADMPAVVDIFQDCLAPCLQRAGLHWERGYYDRPMNPGEDHLPPFLYIFQNPYRARLLDPTEKWPGYYCAEGDWAWFAPLTRTACQFPGWLLQWRLYAVEPPPTARATAAGKPLSLRK
jgi:REP element-mobilizing transposase RayT